MIKINFLKNKDRFYMRIITILLLFFILLLVIKSFITFIKTYIDISETKTKLENSENINKLESLKNKNQEKEKIEKIINSIEEKDFLKEKSTILPSYTKVLESLGKEIEIRDVIINDLELELQGRTEKYENIFKFEKILFSRFEDKKIEIKNIENQDNHFSFTIFIGDLNGKKD